MKLFNLIANRFAYALAVALCSASGIWLAAAYGFFIIAGILRVQEQVLHVFLLSTVAGVVLGTMSHYIQYGLLQPLGFPGYSGNIKTINRMLHKNYPLQDTTSVADQDLLRLLRAVERLPLDNARTAGLYTLCMATFIAMMVGAAGKSVYYAVTIIGAGIVVTIIHIYFTFMATEYFTNPLMMSVKKSLYARGVSCQNEYLFSLEIKAYYLLFLIVMSMGVLTIVILRGGSPAGIGVFLAVGVLTHGLVIYAFWKTFTISLQQISRAAVELASGSEGVFFPASTDKEIVAFSANYNLAAAEVNSIRANLERNVAERTAELEHVKEELEIQNQALILSNQRLQELDKMKSAFLSSVSHELRTPLTSVLGFATTTRKRFRETVLPRLDLDEKRLARATGQISDNLDIIVQDAERLTTLIDDVMDLAKMEAERTQWRREPLQIGEVVDMAAACAAPLVQAKGLRLVKDIEKGLPEVLGDHDRLIQAVFNLLANAVKFTARGSVTCVVRRSGEGVTVSVSDTGIGIPRQDWGKVFEDFHQLGDTLTAKPPGTGLGLSIARRIIEHYGGRIWLVSEPGQGSTFSFSLPTGNGANLTEPGGAVAVAL